MEAVLASCGFTGEERVVAIAITVAAPAVYLGALYLTVRGSGRVRQLLAVYGAAVGAAIVLLVVFARVREVVVVSDEDRFSLGLAAGILIGAVEALRHGSEPGAGRYFVAGALGGGVIWAAVIFLIALMFALGACFD